MKGQQAMASKASDRVSVDVKQFREAVALVGKCVERRNTVPILDAMRVSVNGKMEITGTDLDMVMAVSMPCEAFAGGKVKPATYLMEDHRYVAKAVGAAGGKVATFGHDKDGLAVEAGALSLAMPSNCAIDDWPADSSSVVERTFSAKLSAEQLMQIGRVMAAVSTEETRYYLNGVYFHHVEGWTWRAVATNGHVLMFVDLQLPDADASPDLKGTQAGVIFPRKAIRIALESLGKSVDGVALEMGGGVRSNQESTTALVRPDAARITLQGEVGVLGIRLSTKSIDGTFPDYRRVIPSGWPITLLMPAAKLRQAINAVAHTYGRTPAVKLVLTKDGMEVRAASQPKGLEAIFKCAAKHDAPEGFTIGFNGIYLLNCLAALKGPDVTIGLTDAAGPTVIRDPADTAFMSILMPMRVD